MKESRIKREPSEEIDLLDTMLSTLVDLLIEKGIIKEEEYENRLKQRVKAKECLKVTDLFFFIVWFYDVDFLFWVT